MSMYLHVCNVLRQFLGSRGDYVGSYKPFTCDYEVVALLHNALMGTVTSARSLSVRPHGAHRLHNLNEEHKKCQFFENSSWISMTSVWFTTETCAAPLDLLQGSIQVVRVVGREHGVSRADFQIVTLGGCSSRRPLQNPSPIAARDQPANRFAQGQCNGV